MNPGMSTIRTFIDSSMCTVTVDGNVLKAGFPQRMLAMGVMSLMLLAGIVSVLYGLYGLAFGGSDSGIPTVSGTVLLIGSAVFLRWASTEHGDVSVGADGISWKRGGKVVGIWAWADIHMLKTSRSLLNTRGPRSADYQLHAHTTAGQTIRIAHGIHDEIQAIESWIQENWLVSAPPSQ